MPDTIPECTIPVNHLERTQDVDFLSFDSTLKIQYGHDQNSAHELNNKESVMGQKAVCTLVSEKDLLAEAFGLDNGQERGWFNTKRVSVTTSRGKRFEGCITEIFHSMHGESLQLKLGVGRVFPGSRATILNLTYRHHSRSWFLVGPGGSPASSELCTGVVLSQ